MDVLVYWCCWLSCVLCTNAALEFLVEPQSTAIRIGDDLTLNCAAKDPESKTISLQYDWLFNDVPVNQSLPQAEIFHNHSLFVPAVKHANLGEYECVVQVVGQPNIIHSKSALVLHTYLQGFAIEPVSVNASQGDAVSLQCVTGLGAPPPTLHWMKDGRLYTGQQTVATFGGKGDWPAAGQKSGVLRIQSVTVSDIGSYWCVQTNPLTGDQMHSSAVNITVLANLHAPYLLYDMSVSDILLAAGVAHSLSCPIDGFPTPTCYWTCNGRLTQQPVSSNGSLLFMPVKRTSGGEYMCHCNNSEGIMHTPSVNVSVSYLDMYFVKSPSDVLVTAGDPLRLPCIPPASFPAAYISWYRNNVPFVQRLSGEFSAFVHSDGSLQFSNVQLADAADYICLAHNNYSVPTTRATAKAHITVQASPTIVEPPIGETLQKGSLLQLPCVVSGRPRPVITWLRGDREVTHDSRTSFSNFGQELVIRDVTKADEGMYYCHASNTLGTVLSAGVLIKVIVPPEITTPTKDVLAVDGATVTLMCEAYASPSPYIRWYKDGVLLLVDSLDRLQQTNKGLEISNLIGSDSGLYRCVVSNEGGELTSEAQLTVYVRPKLTGLSGPSHVNQTDSALFYCEASGFPQPNITWLFNKSSTLLESMEVDANSHTLRISSVNINHSGIYTCVASNIVSSVQDSTQMFVQVKPTILAVNGSHAIDRHSDLHLACIVRGIPQPVVTWYQQGYQVIETSDLRVTFPQPNELNVGFVSSVDAGIYQCRAENAAGFDTFDHRVFIVDSPSPPHLLDAQPVSSLSVVLSWRPSLQLRYVKVDSFVVQYKTKSSLSFDTYREDIGSDVTNVTVTPLYPATEYVFRIAARNHIATGVYSSVLVATTWNNAPSAPRALTLLSHNSTVIQLQWEEPNEKNGAIRTYEVLYRQKFSEQDFKQVTIDFPSVPLQRFTLSNLRPFTTFEVKVRAATIENGHSLWSGYSTTLVVTTAAAVPSEGPGSIQLFVVSSRSIQVSWQSISRENENGPLRNYIIKYKQSKMTGFSELIVDIHRHQAVITSLLPWRYYHIHVVVTNDIGEGPASSEHTARTLAEVPTGSPRDVKVHALSSSSLEVEWQSVDIELQNSELSGYVVRYMDKQSGLNSSHYVASANSMQTIIKELKAWTYYIIQVQAYTTQVRDGFGPLSSAVTQRTLSDVPGVIENLTAVTYTSYVILSWQAPHMSNGIIQLYRVSYSTLNVSEVPRVERDVSASNMSEVIRSFMTADLSANISNLQPQSVYMMSVIAKTDAGWGPASNITLTTLAPSVGVETQSPSEVNSVGPEMQTEMQTVSDVDTDRQTGLSKEELAGVIASSTVLFLVLIVLICLLTLFCCRHQQQQQQHKHVYIASTEPSVATIDQRLDSSTSNLIQLQNPHRGSSRLPPSNGNVAYDWHYGMTEPSWKGHNRTTTAADTRWQQRGSSAASSMAGVSNSSAHGPLSTEGWVGEMDNQVTCRVQPHSNRGMLDRVYNAEDERRLPTTVKSVLRMKRDNAAAIAIKQNSNLPGDRDVLIASDSVVVFHERTAL